MMSSQKYCATFHNPFFPSGQLIGNVTRLEENAILAAPSTAQADAALPVGVTVD